MIRKLSATLGVASLAVLMAAAGPASAKVITGTPDNDALTGTPVADRIRGLAGDDDITGHKGDDWLVGDEGFDFFHWANGDGHDRIDGGDDVDSLSIDMGKRLNLHVGAIGAEQPTATKGKLQQISIKDIEFIETSSLRASGSS